MPHQNPNFSPQTSSQTLPHQQKALFITPPLDPPPLASLLMRPLQTAALDWRPELPGSPFSCHEKWLFFHLGRVDHCKTRVLIVNKRNTLWSNRSLYKLPTMAKQLATVKWATPFSSHLHLSVALWVVVTKCVVVYQHLSEKKNKTLYDHYFRV